MRSTNDPKKAAKVVRQFQFNAWDQVSVIVLNQVYSLLLNKTPMYTYLCTYLLKKLFCFLNKK